KDGQVATVNEDIAAARKCFEATTKNLNTVTTLKKKKKAEQPTHAVNSIRSPNLVDLDAQLTKKENKEEKLKDKEPGTEKIYRPIPDGDFEIIPLGEDPTKGIKIGTGLPNLVKRQLEACLKENVELFAWSAAEMPGID
ncbi:hypothetical protein A2U01_0056096, partial [Trifolium medium]|nr:hypothetical protein [Trifolium medium]